jgi:hypothetical protein
MTKNAIHEPDFFVGGVPAHIIYRIESENLAKVVNSSRRRYDDNTRDSLIEVCFIGLAAYFEGFCKNQFASIVNICPETLNNFTDRRDNSTIKLPHLVKMVGDINHRVGALLAEEYDFGSARTINSLYFDLVGLTPFSKDEEEQYNEFLSDRNLLVHHGGIYTMKYHEQRFRTEPVSGLVHWHSLRVTAEDFKKWRSFLDMMVVKISETTHKAISNLVKSKSIQLKRVNKKALWFLEWKESD